MAGSMNVFQAGGSPYSITYLQLRGLLSRMIMSIYTGLTVQLLFPVTFLDLF